MKRSILTFILMGMCFGQMLFGQWSPITSPTTSSSNFRLSFPQPDTGFAIVSSSIGSDNWLYRTDDAGGSWTNKNFMTAESPDMQALSFPTTEYGYVAYRSSAAGPLSMFVAKSTDGGSSWVDVSPDSAEVGYGIAAIDFADTSNGLFMAGEAIYQTSDGGLTWTEFKFGYDYQPKDGSMFDADHMLVGCWDGTFLYSGALLWSHDGGATWDSLNFTHANSEIDRVQMLDSNHLYALSNGYGFPTSSQNIYLSSDGGMVWDSIDLGWLSDTLSNTLARDFHFIQPNEVVLITEMGEIWNSLDSGNTWVLEDSTDEFFSDLEVKDRVGYIGGANQVMLRNGALLLGNVIICHDQRTRLFPNPTQDIIHLTSPLKVRFLQVRDLQGRILYTEKDPFKLSGTGSNVYMHQIDLNVSAWPKGVYMLTIRTEENDHSMRFVKF